MLAVNLFHMRGGRVLDRREFFWEDLPEFTNDHAGADAPVRPAEQSSADVSPASFNPGEFFSALLKQLYIGQPYVPRNIYVPVEFEDRETLEEVLSEQIAGASVRIRRGSTFSSPSAARNVRCSTWRATMPSSPTTSASG